MSLVIELEREGKKAGNVCDRSYRRGNACPLIVRQTSEDVLTANVFGVLRRLRPELWFEPMMRTAFPRSSPIFADATPEVSFWLPVDPPPERLHDEGQTEVDVMIRSGSTCLYIEAKFRAELSPRTTADPNRDQLIRLLDVAYSHEVDGQLFPREPFVLVLGMWDQEPGLVTRYRSPTAVRDALAGRCPNVSFGKAEYLARHVGYLSWKQLAEMLDAAGSATSLERSFLGDLAGYIRHKKAQLPVVQDHVFDGGAR